MPTRHVPVPASMPLSPTLRPLSMAWGAFAGDGWWRAFRTPVGGVTLRIARHGGTATGTAWGPGAGWILDRLDELVGGGDPGGFDPDHQALKRLHRSHPSRFGRTSLVGEALVFAVLGQRVTRREAHRAARAITRRHSDPAPGPRPDLWLPPDPRRLADMPYHAFHPFGVERHRADTIRRVAGSARLLEAAAGATPHDAARMLARVPGVGSWTVAETLVVSHGDVDAVSVGDFHLKHQVSWHLAGRERGTDEEMLELLEPFRPHRARVVRLLATLGGYPRRGPKRPVTPIAGL